MYKKIIIETSKKQERKVVKKWNNKDYLLNMDNHIPIVNQLYLDQSFAGSVCAKRDIIGKLNSYKQQDIKKNKYSSEFINESELLEKLVISKLKCYYCKKKVLLFFPECKRL